MPKITTETFTFKHADPSEEDGAVYVDHMRTYITVRRNMWERIVDLFRPKSVIVSVQEFTAMVPNHRHQYTMSLRFPRRDNHKMVPATDEPEDARWKRTGIWPNKSCLDWILKKPGTDQADWFDAMDAIWEERLKGEVV